MTKHCDHQRSRMAPQCTQAAASALETPSSGSGKMPIFRTISIGSNGSTTFTACRPAAAATATSRPDPMLKFKSSARSPSSLEAAANGASNSTGDGQIIKLSKRRWAILIGVVIFGLLNGVVNELSSILATLVAFLEIPLDKYVYVTQSFNYISPFIAVPNAWFLDRYGIKTTCYTCLGLVAIRNCFRALMFSPEAPDWYELRLVYWIVTGIITQVIIVSYYCLPLKISESWFAKEERSVAWAAIVSVPTLGGALSSLVTPRIVNRDDPNSVRPLAYINYGCLAITAVAICLGVTKSTPKYAPSERSSKASNSANKQSFMQSVKCLLSSPNVLIQILAITTFDSCMSAINCVLQDVLSASGLSQVFTGQFMAFMSIAAVVLQLVSSFVMTDRSGDKGVTALCKLYMVLQCLTFLAYAGCLSLSDFPEQQWWLIIITALAYSICRFWSGPSYLNVMAYLISGHISEATFGAANTVASSFLGNSISFLFIYLRRVDPNQSNRPDYRQSILLLACTVIAVTTLYLTCFSGKTLGGKAGKQAAAANSTLSTMITATTKANIESSSDSVDPIGCCCPRCLKESQVNSAEKLAANHSTSVLLPIDKKCYAGTF